MKYCVRFRDKETLKESPSVRREWIEIDQSIASPDFPSSPSVRREWIEINFIGVPYGNGLVSLRPEGVD